MVIECVWEHNGNDTLLYPTNLPGAYTRGASLDTAVQKMPNEARAYLKWKGEVLPKEIAVKVVQSTSCKLNVRDADSDVIFDTEKTPLTLNEYNSMKKLVLKSAADFLTLYNAVPNKSKSDLPIRDTFYGQIPRTADEMYIHTKNVNEYYFREIGVHADNNGSISDCRRKGFDILEQAPDFLSNNLTNGSYGEDWTLRKVMRRFIWHDRIHAKAMYRMSVRLFGGEQIPDIFYFKELI